MKNLKTLNSTKRKDEVDLVHKIEAAIFRMILERPELLDILPEAMARVQADCERAVRNCRELFGLEGPDPAPGGVCVRQAAGECAGGCDRAVKVSGRKIIPA